MNHVGLFLYHAIKPDKFLAYRVFTIFILFTFSHLNAQISFLEIKNYRAQTATYGQIDLSKKRGIKKSPQFQIKLPPVDTFATDLIATNLTDNKTSDAPLDVLIYIHAMWGGADFFESKILRTFAPEILAPEGRIDEILTIIWHAGTDYQKNLPKAYKMGQSLGANIGFIMRQVKENSTRPVRFHLLCHSMGHQVFRGIYSVNLENDQFNFGDIIFAAPDVDYEIFGKEWGGLPGKAERITYFVNENDRALKISEKKLKIKRLGKDGSVVKMRDSVEEINVSNIKDTKGFSPKYTGHGYLFASKTVREIIIHLLNK